MSGFGQQPRFSKSLIGWLLLAAVLTIPLPPRHAQAAEAPIIRAEVTPSEVNVGQPVRLRIAVLVPTWLARPSVYPGFELANAITRLPSESSRPFSERIGNDTWSGVVREYEIYPQLAARFEMKDQRVRVSQANPGSAPAVSDVVVPDVVFRAVVPAGAEQLTPYLGGTRLTLQREIEGSLENLVVGGAIVFSVTATIEGMPAPFLPPLIPEPQAAGLMAYPREPRLLDGAIASRIESVTWVLNGGGDFSLPAIELGWWNTKTRSLEVARLPALPFSVSGPPAEVHEPVAGLLTGRLRMVFLLSVALVGLMAAFIVGRAVPILRGWLARRRTARLASEAHAFQQLRMAIGRCDHQETDRWLALWSERLDPNASLARIAARSGTPQLLEELAEISHARFAPGSAAGQQQAEFAALGKTVLICRANYLSWLGRATAGTVLPPLNPL